MEAGCGHFYGVNDTKVKQSCFKVSEIYRQLLTYFSMVDTCNDGEMEMTQHRKMQCNNESARTPYTENYNMHTKLLHSIVSMQPGNAPLFFNDLCLQLMLTLGKCSLQVFL